jgi:6-phospho-3-hexuloisomerase
VPTGRRQEARGAGRSGQGPLSHRTLASIMINTLRFDEVRFIAVDELRPLLAAVEASGVEHLAQALGEAPRVYCAGAGRSGLAIRAFAMRLMHLGMDAHVVGDATTPALRPKDLVVIGSASGVTGSLVSIAEKARLLGGVIALVTVNADSPIGRIADVLLRIPASTPKPRELSSGGADGAEGTPAAVFTRQPMASLFEQALWILLDAVILLLMRRKKITSDAMFARHANLE